MKSEKRRKITRCKNPSLSLKWWVYHGLPSLKRNRCESVKVNEPIYSPSLSPIPCIHGLSMPPVWDQKRCDGYGCDGVGGGGSGGASDGNGIRQVEQKYCIRQKIYCLVIFDRTRMQILINCIRLRLIYNLFAHSAIMSSLPPPPPSSSSSPSLSFSLENAEFAQTA